MNSDKKILYIFSFALLGILSLSLFYSAEYFKIFLAVFLVIYVFLVCYFIKKRSILSIYKKQIWLIVLLSSLLFIMGYYLLGIKYNFYYSLYPFSLSTLFKYIIPILVSVISFEIIRYLFLSQKNKIVNIITYITGVLVEILLVSTIASISTFNQFMDVVGLTLLPAITSNIFYQYTSKRYGCVPNIVYKLITTLYLYIIPVVPGVADSMFALFKLFVPLIILVLIKFLYEKRERKALEKKNIFAHIIVGMAFVGVILMTMVFSCQFKYGALVIATDSMTGELNKGDIVFFEQYDGDTISLNDIVLFKDGESIYVHRVVMISDIDGEIRYYTKGDANPTLDMGYRVESDIVGVTTFKTPYFGYITLWLREIFE